MRKLEIIYLGASVKGAQILVPVDARKYSFLTSNMVVREGDVILSFERKQPMFVVSIEEDYRSSSITVDGKPIPLQYCTSTELMMTKSSGLSPVWRFLQRGSI